MKAKHLAIRVAQCDLLASCSPCPRRKVGALIIEPSTNSVISEGYNGTPRGSNDELCGGSVCLRACRKIKSGTQNDVGCHHAEANAILNAVRVGASTLNTWLITNCAPCLMCAKLIHHAGIVRVYSPDDDGEGTQYLLDNNVAVSVIIK
jgi:dCMP deaminase